jgi:hypothetical protein
VSGFGRNENDSDSDRPLNPVNPVNPVNPLNPANPLNPELPVNSDSPFNVELPETCTELLRLSEPPKVRLVPELSSMKIL